MRSPAFTTCILAALSLASTIRAQAQLPPSADSLVAKAPPDYAAESIVIERVDVLHTYAADGTAVEERTLAARIQSDAAVRSLGVISIAFAAESQHVEFLYARVRHPDGTVAETPPSDTIELAAPVTREAPFYSDLKEKQLPIRSMRRGDTLEWKARITTTRPQAPNQVWGEEIFSDDAVALSRTLELRVPASLHLKLFSPTLKPVESELPASASAPALHVYRWSSSYLTPTTGKEAEAAAAAKKKTPWTPGQELDADEGKLPTVAWSSFQSWQQVGEWYRTLQADRIDPSPEVKAKVAELIAGKTTNEDKVRALYAYVSTQIRYIGVAFGIGRYQPHTAAEILANQYGDCKDKHTLLAAMLSAAGIRSDAVLIGAGIRFNPDLPSPSAFNHLITHLTLSPAPGQPAQSIWLDTTAEIAPYRMLVPLIRDHQALVVPAADAEPFLDRTPADPPFPTAMDMQATGSIGPDGISHSRLTFIARGDSELQLRAAFHQVAPAQYPQLVQQFVQGIGYGGTSSNPDVSRPEDTTQPFTFSFDYEREKAGDWDNLKIIPQVAPIALPRFADSDPLIRSLDLGSPRVETSHAAMKIPENWGVVLPEAQHYKSRYATYDETYRFDKGTVYTERRIEVLKQKVPTSDLTAYKKWANDADLGNEFYIQLVKHGSGSPSNPSSASNKTENDEAAQLIEQAKQLYRDHKISEMEGPLDKARKLNPEQAGLWSLYGLTAMMRGDYKKAIEDLQKEIKLHPDAIPAYEILAGIYSMQHKSDELVATLRAWIVADPSDPKPVSALVHELVDRGDSASAAKLGEAALPAIDPKAGTLEVLRTEIGVAEIKSGDTTKGRATIEDILSKSENPLVINNAAYGLAEANIDLPLAEKSIQAALATVAAETAAWTLDEDANTLGRSSEFAPMWDTLGWILFREGKLPEARTYLTAAWTSSPSAASGEHLGDLLVASGDKKAALAVYELASTAALGAQGGNNHPPATPSIQRKIDALKHVGVLSAPGEPRMLIQDLRTFPLSSARPSKGQPGTAEYRILLRSGKAVKVQPSGDNPIPHAEDWIMAADFSRFFPSNSTVTLARTGFVTCLAATCELVLAP